MKTLQRLALGTALVAMAAVMLGSWTRINGAGLTCPDWPLCHGQVVPSLANGTIWEWLHRLAACCVTPLVVALVAVAWRFRNRSAFIAPAAAAIAALFLAQVLLGAATVHLANSPLSVVLHWGTAMAFIASVCALAVFAGAAVRDDAAPPTAAPLPWPGLSAILWGTAAVAFVTMCFGAYVSSSGAGL
ncbi:MAG: COX15/CtaA family protein, partial [Candidatus Eremiobacteraeota bacterium]|nr:COX15/CtaA family protein [Candidatus Eremiobacteraeota bacterium]